jgi:hypothetical protein
MIALVEPDQEPAEVVPVAIHTDLQRLVAGELKLHGCTGRQQLDRLLLWAVGRSSLPSPKRD